MNVVDVIEHVSLQRGVGAMGSQIFLHLADAPCPDIVYTVGLGNFRQLGRNLGDGGQSVVAGVTVFNHGLYAHEAVVLGVLVNQCVNRGPLFFGKFFLIEIVRHVGMGHRHGLGQIAIGIVAFTLQGGYLIRAVLESLVLQTHGDGAGVGLVGLVGLAVVPAGNLDVLLRLLVLDEVNAAFSEHGVEFLNHHAPLGVVAGSGQVGLSHEVERAVGGMSRQIVGCSRNNPVDVGAHISLQRGVGVVRVEIFLHFAHGPIPGSLVGRAVFLEFGLYFGGHFGHGGQGIDLVGGAGRLHAHVGIAFVLVDILVGQSQVGFVQTRAGRVLIVGDEGMGQAHGLFHVVIHLDAVALERRHLVAAVGHLLAHAHVDFRGVVHRLVGLGVVLADNVHELARTFIIYKVCAAGGSLAGRRGHLQRPQAFVARVGSGIVERTVALGRQVIGVARFNLIDIGFQQSLQRGTAAAALKVFNGFALGPRPHAVGHTVILGLLLHFLGNGGNHGHGLEVVALRL